MNRSLLVHCTICALLIVFCAAVEELSCKLQNDLSKKFCSMDAQIRMMEETLKTLKTMLNETPFLSEAHKKETRKSTCPEAVDMICPNTTYPECPHVTCPTSPSVVEDKNSALPTDCSGYLERGIVKNGIYKVMPFHYSVDKPIDVLCDMETDGGGWTVFQRRDDFGEPREDFFRNWTDYKRGFGDLNKEFWLGNDNLFALTNQQMSLRVDLADFEGESRYAKYQDFLIKSEGERYAAIFRGFTGNAGNSLSLHSDGLFATKDKNIEYNPSGFNCAQIHQGAWWYEHDCYMASNLNGVYLKGESTHGVGVNWYTWRGYKYSLKSSEMKFRPKSFRSPS